MEEATPMFKVDIVTFNSKSQQIIKGISLEIPKGTVTSLVGKAGSGKSTLLKLIAGVLVPTSGRIFYNSVDIQQMSSVQNKEFRCNCSFVFQDSALWANQDIASNISLPLQIHYPNMSADEIRMSIDSVCAMVNYDRPLTLRPSDLSMGEQKKVAFARAMICGPSVLFLDECTESLDRKGREIILNLLHNFIEQGNSIIYVSHSSTFLREFPGKMYNIENGLISNSQYDIEDIWDGGLNDEI